MRKTKDITGEKFGIFTVLKRVDKPEGLKNKYSYWLCRCKCGENTVFSSEALKNGYIKCNNCKARNDANERIKLRGIWHKMINRCNNKNDNNYKNYGARGISVNFEWLIFEDFYNDMIDSYKNHSGIHGANNTTLDRIDVDGDYCKSNCRWATKLEQNRNKRTTIKSVIHGEEYITLTDISLKFSIDYKTLQDRYSRGLRNEELIKDVRIQKKKDRGRLDLNINGKIYNNFNEVHRDYSYLNRQTIIDRYDKGLRGEYLVKDKFFYMSEDGVNIINSIRET